LRIEFPGALYHVTSRGDRQEPIYEDDEDRHVLFGADMEGQNVRVVTAYYPSPEEWEADLKTRRRPP
jgi:hypothetical protein